MIMREIELIHQRLMNHAIAGPGYACAQETVLRMGAIQAQDYGQALWAIGSRVPDANIHDVEQAVATGAIVRTWQMRGTIHFVPSEDVRWMLQLLTPRVSAQFERRQKELGLDATTMEKAMNALGEGLNGRHRPRTEVLRLFNNAGINTDGQRGYHLLTWAAQTGLICIGPTENKQQTFALLDQWAPTQRELDPEMALTELTQRYFSSHGPASAYDFAYWSGLTVTQAKQGIKQAALKSVLIDGQEYWFYTLAEPVVHPPTLLAGFDEYLLGYKDRKAIVPHEHASFLTPGNNGVFRPMLVVDGRIAGTWQRTIKKSSVAIVMNIFNDKQRISKKALESAALRYAAFLDLPISSLEVD